ncbi:MAG: bifunctional diguanylate cyclase/phosphodiesterase [Spirochaetaceae bacterium]|nr:MAG: bifunctional diguanylate cyclase/phosphodiesterase [Spirochaetaceae bacterium]
MQFVRNTSNMIDHELRWPQRIQSFFFYARPEKDSVPLQTRVTLIALYTVCLASLVANPFNIIGDFKVHAYFLASTQIIYVSLLIAGLVVFWTTRLLSSARAIFAVAVLILIFGMIVNRGGHRGLGFFYLISGYTILYYILGLRGGILVPLFILVGGGASILLGNHGPASYLNKPDFVWPYLVIMSVATVLGIFSVIYQHLVIKHLYQAAYIDETTGLPSRARLEQIIQEKINHQRSSSDHFSLIGLKLIQFARINSFQGTSFADELLAILSKRLKEIGNGKIIAARYTGTVFIFMCETTDFLELDETGKQILATAQKPISLEGRTISLQAGVSITRFPQDGTTTERLVANLMASFSRMRNQPGLVSFFDESHHRAEARKFSLIEELRNAIVNEELYLVYHPKIELKSGLCHGCEVLLRWESRRFGPIGPDVFISLAEEAGIISDITRWVVNEAVRTATELCKRFPDAMGKHSFAINLSPIDLNDSNFSEYLHPIMLADQISNDQFEFEITEGIVMNENPLVHQNLEMIQKNGFRLAIDDFGTGYSSLSYLHRLKAHNLKIDRSFIMQINESKPEAPIVDAIISMAKSLEMQITAEGVETDFQQAYLIRKGCTLGQGWLYAKPLVFEQYIEWIKNNCEQSKT